MKEKISSFKVKKPSKTLMIRKQNNLKKLKSKEIKNSNQQKLKNKNLKQQGNNFWLCKNKR